MSIHCPFCNSERVRTRNIARKLGRAAGAAGGAATGAANVVVGARSGASIGAVAGTVGIALGGLAGAILGGLAGGAVGSLAGARLGEEIDARVLDNFECQACGHVFFRPRQLTPLLRHDVASAFPFTDSCARCCEAERGQSCWQGDPDGSSHRANGLCRSHPLAWPRQSTHAKTTPRDMAARSRHGLKALCIFKSPASNECSCQLSSHKASPPIPP